MKKLNPNYLLLPFAALLILTPFQAVANAEVKSAFQYNLANFTGKIPFNDVRVRVDRARDEVYVIDGGVVRIFNEAGMEVFSFGDDPELGTIYDLAVDEKGDILLLCYDLSIPDKPIYSIIRCNYRGEIKEKIRVSGLSRDFSRFYPNLLYYRDGNYFLASMGQVQAIVTDRKGVYQKGYNLLQIIGLPEKDRTDVELFGFSLDRAGNMVFTVAVLFKAYVVSPEGKLVGSFGKVGSAPGMFGVVGGIEADDLGNYFVVERLRSVVMVFDKGFNFLHEFGYRGDKPGNLIRPSEVAVGNAGKLYVNQLRDRGVSVFSITYD